MALKVWNGGANNGTFLDAANWVGGVAPVATDSILINDTEQNINGVTTAFAIVDFTVGPRYRGTIGADGVSLIFTNITGTLQYGGSGAGIRIGCSGTCAAAKLEHTLGMVWITGGTWTSVINGTGNVDIAAAAVLTAGVNISGTMTIGYNATVITNLHNFGYCEFKRSATNVYAKRGTTVQKDSGSTTTQVTDLLQVENGAVYNKQSGGTEDSITVFPGGLFTIEGNTGGATGTLNLGTITKYAGAKTKTRTMPGVIVTVTLSSVGTIPGMVDE